MVERDFADEVLRAGLAAIGADQERSRSLEAAVDAARRAYEAEDDELTERLAIVARRTLELLCTQALHKARDIYVTSSVLAPPRRRGLFAKSRAERSHLLLHGWAFGSTGGVLRSDRKIVFSSDSVVTLDGWARSVIRGARVERATVDGETRSVDLFARAFGFSVTDWALSKMVEQRQHAFQMACATLSKALADAGVRV